MIDPGIFTLGIGALAFIVLAGFYEWRRPNWIAKLVSLSVGVGSLIGFLNWVVVDGTGGLVTMTVPHWLGEFDAAVAGAFYVFPGYALWRWKPDPSEGFETDRKRRLYRHRWIYYGLSVLLSGMFVSVIVLLSLIAGGS